MHAVKVSFFGRCLWRGFARLLCCLAIFLAGAAGASAQSSATPLNSISQIGGRLAECWHAPQTGSPQIIEVTVRLRFSRNGAVTGEPRTAFIRADSVPGLREKINASIIAAIKACTPLSFTPSLGAAVAGRMLAIRFRSLPLSGKLRVI
jgi:hypothetical protein